ncbi:transmembrane protein 181 isoform X2 [Onychostoma macrolepis]|uniref:transmembrane protein 181 isoform X2 n=1 Tax=Onychostoma macrolepis TaxID=369639 RepID=UPI00272D8188|nr:transmembrane protein 181 isoform X2 [Onychostoma macrolepis]
MERPESFEKPLLGEMKRLCRRIQDAFSELQEDLTPYKTERFYRLAPMRLYTLSKRHFVLVFVVFFFCFGVSMLIGVSGPKIISENYYNGLSLSINGSKSGPFDLRSPPLSNYNQQLWLTCIIQLDRSNLSWDELGMNVELQGVMQDASVMHIRDNVHNKNRSLRCAARQQACDEIIVLHLGYLNYTQYKINVSFRNLQEGLKDKIKNVTFVFKMYNATFSQVEIWFRFVFVVMTFIVTCMFAHSLRKFSMRDWGIEQKWMSILLPLLLLYNDPFFPLSFLVNSWFPGTLDAFFQALFLCALLLFWLCVYHGIRVQGDRRFLTFYLPKLLIVGLLWLSAVTLGIWQTVNELQDPTYQYKVDIQNFQGMKVFFLLLVAVYVLYLVFLVLCACSELKNAPYTDLRLKFLTALTLLVLVISVVILYLRFGSKALQDNFVAELSTHYQNSAEFLSFYGLLNFYLYTLAFVYSPSRNALYDSQLKDNPAFSMLNDSDDEVIYGSDYEEMPLQNGRAIKASAKYQDESESD